MLERNSAPLPGAAQRLERGEISRNNLRRLVDHWNGLRGARQMPARRDLRPEDLSFILAQVMLIDVHRASDPAPGVPQVSFRFRLVGTRIEEAGHPGLQGRWVHELMPLAYRRLVLQAYSEAVRESAPNFYRVALDHGGQQLRYERVTLPLGDGGGFVDSLLVGTDWEPANDEFFRVYPAIRDAAQDAGSPDTA
jgi:hypothetical protein